MFSLRLSGDALPDFRAAIQPVASAFAGRTPPHLPVGAERREAAVDRQIETGEKARLVAGEEHHRLNDVIKVCRDTGDNGTREILEKMLREEESHADWLETQQEAIKQIGVEQYLAEQLK